MRLIKSAQSYWTQYTRKFAAVVLSMEPRTMFMAAAAGLGVAIVIAVATARTRSNGQTAKAGQPAASAVTVSTESSAKPVPARPVTPSTEKESAKQNANAQKTQVAKAVPVTITGCLQQDADSYQLKDTEGVDAPKGRSWKTGFLTKRTKSIELVGATNAVKSRVGQRVSVTGMLTDRKMQVRSVQSVSSSCETKAA